jgi:hypothetical protein
VANCRRYQRHRWQIATGINDTGGKFSTGVNDTGGKIAAGINDTGGKFATGINDGNNIRLQTPESELEGKNLYICFLYYPKVTKQNY